MKRCASLATMGQRAVDPIQGTRRGEGDAGLEVPRGDQLGTTVIIGREIEVRRRSAQLIVVMNNEPVSRERGPPVTLRRMTPADVPFAMELKNIAGWNQTTSDWLGYLDYEPEGCFIAEMDGRAVGTSTTIRYDGRFGWIGMVLVRPEFRRAGIGSTLLAQAISHLQRRGTVAVKLDATPMGRKVYVPMGFRDEYEVSRFEGVAAAEIPALDPGVRPLVEGDLADLVPIDAATFGAERDRVLRSMMRRNPEYCFILREGPGIQGYIIAREGHTATQIGPWVACDGVAAERLLRALFARLSGRRLLVDVPHPNETGCALIRRCGFTVQRGFTRMYLGENRHPGTPEQVFGTSSAEKG